MLDVIAVSQSYQKYTFVHVLRLISPEHVIFQHFFCFFVFVFFFALNQKKVKHSKLSEGVEAALNDKKYVTSVDPSQLDLCYPAIIQSGGSYALKFAVLSDKNYLHFGAIVCSLGTRYKSYCSNISRTLLVNPTDKVQEHYNFVLNLEEELLKNLVPGAKLSTIYESVVIFAKKEKPELLDNLTKSFGFAMGIEFRENSVTIGPKCGAILKKNMVFNLYVGLSNLTNKDATDKAGKVYALFIADTVIVNEEGPASVLTQSKKKIKNIGIFLRDNEEGDEDAEEEEETGNRQEILGRGKRSTVLDTKLRQEQNSEEKRKQHQKELALQLNEKARERLEKKDGVKETEKIRKSTVSYKNVNQMPREPEVKELKLFVGKWLFAKIFSVGSDVKVLNYLQIKNMKPLLCLSLAFQCLSTYPQLKIFHSRLKAIIPICVSISFIPALQWVGMKVECIRNQMPLL